MYVDSHAHLDMNEMSLEREAILTRAREAGVETIVAIPSEAASLDGAVRVAEHYDWIYATIGIHPHEASAADEALYSRLAELAKHKKVIAWGEIGLDYHYDHSPREVQRDVFARQMQLAGEAGLPLVIHCRASQNSDDAWNECLDLVREKWISASPGSELGGVLHCFTGNYAHAAAALDLGFMISFSGAVTFPKAESIRETAIKIPLERVLIETDSPYLAPVPHRGKRNEPAFVALVARKIGELRGVSGEEVGIATTQNFRRFFSRRLSPAG